MVQILAIAGTFAESYRTWSRIIWSIVTAACKLLRQVRHTKIIATLGPASNTPQVLDAMIAAGVDIFRLNFSHGTPDGHRAAVALVREASARFDQVVSVMQDLSGPKIRTGSLVGGEPVELVAGEALTIAIGDFAGDATRVSTTFASLSEAVKPGDRLLLDDGRLQLEVKAATDGEIATRIVDGGMLGEHKGITVPNVTMPTSAVTEKDLDDLALGMELGVDLVAVSFVQSATDIQCARDAMESLGRVVPLIAKIERPQAVERIDEILDVSDGVMVARGDLGLELPLERLPGLQKRITRRARQVGVPVIVATQVLESMVRLPRPTRAEVSDAANAVVDGVDAIMLAGETAAGAFPVKAVETLDRVARDAESELQAAGLVVQPLPEAWHGPSLCEAAVTLAAGGQADAIVAITRGGETARMLSRLRPGVPIFAATDREPVARWLTLRWGVVPIVTTLVSDLDETGSAVERLLLDRGSLAPGSVVVFVNVTADIGADGANFLKLRRLGD